ncbi:MAG: hypothetical protein H0V02_08585 [Nocardioidaceae bacterium]|nr:hypothetical protein [Nocardioidaceae bacterium]
MLPLSYAVDSMRRLQTTGLSGDFWADIAVVIGFVIATVALGAATLKRRTA